MLAQVDWLFLSLAGLLLLMLATWPFFRRLVRAANLAYAEGDVARSRDVSLHLLHSWLPPVLLERLVNPGHAQAVLAERSRLLGEYADALQWGAAGLRKARKPATLILLHQGCALAHAAQGHLDLARPHLEAASQVALRLGGRQPATLDIVLTDASTAIFCCLRAGAVGEAVTIANQRVETEG